MLKIKKSKKGFTLIELLIVVAIIAILAAIAIPQFAAYRIRGYNAAANSDLRNAKTAEEALFADFQSYGITAGGAVVLVTPFTLTTQDSSSNTRTLDSGLSNNVSALATGSEDLTGYTNRWQNYTAFAKHVAGDRVFGADDNMTSLYWKLGPVATALANSDAVASTSNADLTGAGGFTAL